MKAKAKRKSFNNVTLGLTIILILTFFMLINTFGNLNAYGDGEQEFITVQVKAGDSLWSIADAYTPDHRDLRETMSIIRRYNHLNSDNLMVGDQLEVPKIY
ncbi:MAG: LysM peptidoglycan-binding domain-containing protein [Clostridia bacterium]|nr:LysM peptidoglycan-binding domain-containing protein [Clostridia bacterium]